MAALNVFHHGPGMMLEQNANEVTPPERGGLSSLRTALLTSSAPVGPVITYFSYNEAFKEFNRLLLGGKLRPALITLSNGVGRFGACSRNSVADSENPNHTADLITLRRDHAGTVVENLSDLFRNMLRLSLYDDPKEKASRPNYYSAEFCRRMEAAGLPTYVIDKRDGTKIYKKPGESVHHEVDPEGAFARICAALLDQNNTVLYLDRPLGVSEEDEKAARIRTKKAKSKSRFVCPKSREEALTDPTTKASEHYKQKLWAHGKTNVHCGFCLTAMTPG